MQFTGTQGHARPDSGVERSPSSHAPRGTRIPPASNCCILPAIAASPLPYTLAIETCASPATVAVGVAGAPALERALEGERPDLARFLIPTIDALVADAGAGRRALARVVLGCGPGSYTGLRIGAAAARTLAFAAGAPLAAHASTAAAAHAALSDPARSQHNKTAVCIDMLRGEYAVAIYERGPRHPLELLAPSLAPASALPRLLANIHLVITDRPDALRALADPLCTIVTFAHKASSLLQIDAAGAPPLPRALPLYLRACAAEDKAQNKT